MPVKPQLPLLPVIGMILLMGSASIYTGFGVSAYPRQEWLLELLISAAVLIPVINFLVVPGDFTKAVRLIGAMLLLHSIWDALHWPMLGWVDTPVDPRIPKLCPLFDIPVGIALLVRGR